MDERPLWQKMVVAIAAVLAVAYITYNYYLKAKFKEAEELKTSLKAVEREINLIKPNDIISATSASINQEIEKSLTDISKKIPDEVNTPYLIRDFLSDSSKDLNMEYTLIQPMPPVQEDKYKRIPLTIGINAGFEDLVLYLSRLEYLENSVRIDGMTLTKKEKEEVLDVKMILSLFVMSGGVPSAEGKPNMTQIPNINPFFQSHFNAAAKNAKIAVKKSKKPSGPRFKGVYKGAVIKAFINDGVVGVGETIDGYKVTEITDQKVVVSKNGISYTLKLGR